MISKREIAYETDGKRMLGLLAWDDARTGPRPGILVAHTYAGRNAFVESRIEELAALGYAAFALDLYGEGKVAGAPAEAEALLRPFLEDRALIERGMLSALATLAALPEVDDDRLAAEGFCFGGLCVLDLARVSDDLRGVVSFHGLLRPPAGVPNRPMKSRVLVLHGERDPLIEAEEISALTAEFETRDTDWIFMRLGRAAHAFTNPAAAEPERGVVYEPRTDRLTRAWAQTYYAELFSDRR
ncbi:MAG: dienelactone hydrolase family protein [Pseudomonadota bacterium]